MSVEMAAGGPDITSCSLLGVQWSGWQANPHLSNNGSNDRFELHESIIYGSSCSDHMVCSGVTSCPDMTSSTWHLYYCSLQTIP